jgi:glycosyltransferase involved in cell wall biosynthesis
MHILYLCTDPGIPVFGRKGASIHVQDMIRAFRRGGHRVTLVARRLGGGPPADLEDLAVVPLPDCGRSVGSDRERVLAELDADIPRVIEGLEPIDLIYERHALWSAAAMAWAKVRGRPSVLEVNAPLVEEQASHRTLTDRRQAEAMVKTAMSSADVVICVSDALAPHAIATGADKSRVRVEANGIDPLRFQRLPDRTLPTLNRRWTLGFLGTLKPWHGTSLLVEAAARLVARRRPIELLIIGDGPERANLVLQAEKLGVTAQLRFTGAVDPADVPQFLAAMDIGVAPYPNLAGFYFSPLKFLEYMAAGLPIVASRTGAIPDLLDSGRYGTLVAPDDAAALADALDALIKDPQPAFARAARARRHCLKERSWDGIASRTLAAAYTDEKARIAGWRAA